MKTKALAKIALAALLAVLAPGGAGAYNDANFTPNYVIFTGANGHNVVLQGPLLYSVVEDAYNESGSNSAIVASPTHNDGVFPINQCTERSATTGGYDYVFLATPTPKGTACVGDQADTTGRVLPSPFYSFATANNYDYVNFNTVGKGWCTYYVESSNYAQRTLCISEVTVMDQQPLCDAETSPCDLSKIWNDAFASLRITAPNIENLDAAGTPITPEPAVGSYPLQTPSPSQQQAIIQAFLQDSQGSIDLTQIPIVRVENVNPIEDWRVLGTGTPLCDGTRIQNDQLVADAPYLLGGIFCGTVSVDGNGTTTYSTTIVDFNLTQVNTPSVTPASAPQTYTSGSTGQEGLTGYLAGPGTVGSCADLSSPDPVGKTAVQGACGQ